MWPCCELRTIIVAIKKPKDTPLFPLSPDGSLVHSPNWSRVELQWVPNEVFDAGLAFMGFERSANVVLRNVDTGARYEMLPRHFRQAASLGIPSKVFVDGEERLVLSWIWTYHRGGNNYFVRPCGEQEKD